MKNPTGKSMDKNRCQFRFETTRSPRLDADSPHLLDSDGFCDIERTDGCLGQEASGPMPPPPRAPCGVAALHQSHPPVLTRDEESGEVSEGLTHFAEFRPLSGYHEWAGGFDEVGRTFSSLSSPRLVA
jgi:hypothetical protein